MYRWGPPSSDSPLSLIFVAKKIQPKLFEDYDLDTIIVDYYKEFYGIMLTSDDLYTIYHPSRSAAGL